MINNMKERLFKVYAASLNDRGYAVAKSFQEIGDNNKRQPTTIYTLGLLPGEEAIVTVFKTKRDVFFTHVVELIKKSPDRVEPKDEESYLASSPYQILDFKAEQALKAKFMKTLYNKDIEIVTDGVEYAYRNKVEFGFYEDYENYALNLSFFKREGNSGKYVLKTGTAIADPKINELGLKIVAILEKNKVIGRDLKTLMIRATNDEARANLYVTHEDFLTKYPGLAFDLKDIEVSVIYSDKISPASNNNGFLIKKSQTLTQPILNRKFQLAIDGFFQVNVPVFEMVIADCKSIIAEHKISGSLVDFYSGVGVIGQLLSDQFSIIKGVDSSQESEQYSLINARDNGISNYSFKRSEAEKINDMITSTDILFLDPPRVGCHAKVMTKIQEAKPAYIFYLSCNPISQQFNYSQLMHQYEVIYLKAYNFYPKTPHLESLLVLRLKK